MSLLDRGELSLSNIGFHDLNITKKENYKFKLKIGLKFQKFLYSLMDEIFIELEFKGLNEHQKYFIEYFLAYCYFRIPEFKSKLL